VTSLGDAKALMVIHPGKGEVQPGEASHCSCGSGTPDIGTVGLHPEASHRLADCKQFQRLSVPRRYQLLDSTGKVLQVLRVGHWRRSGRQTLSCGKAVWGRWMPILAPCTPLLHQKGVPVKVVKAERNPAVQGEPGLPSERSASVSDAVIQSCDKSLKCNSNSKEVRAKCLTKPVR